MTPYAITLGSQLLGAVVDLNGRPRYLHSGWFLITVANLGVIFAMIGVFALAIAIPFPRDRDER
jgi:hypothetical protein